MRGLNNNDFHMNDQNSCTKITPRSLMRKQTNTIIAGTSPRVDKVFRRDKTGNMDWIPQEKNKNKPALKVEIRKNNLHSKIKKTNHKELENINSAPYKKNSPTNLLGQICMNSPTVSHISRQEDKNAIKMSKYRWAKRRMRSTQNPNLDRLLNNIDEVKSEELAHISFTKEDK